MTQTLLGLVCGHGSHKVGEECGLGPMTLTRLVRCAVCGLIRFPQLGFRLIFNGVLSPCQVIRILSTHLHPIAPNHALFSVVIPMTSVAGFKPCSGLMALRYTYDESVRCEEGGGGDMRSSCLKRLIAVI